jgi:hypothetical protein
MMAPLSASYDERRELDRDNVYDEIWTRVECECLQVSHGSWADVDCRGMRMAIFRPARTKLSTWPRFSMPASDSGPPRLDAALERKKS